MRRRGDLKKMSVPLVTGNPGSAQSVRLDAGGKDPRPTSADWVF